MAACRQLPPGKSTNTTASAPPIACSRRFPSSPLSHPSLLTGTSPPDSPVICFTASTMPDARAAWDSTMPFNSLIVFGEVFTPFPLLRHAADEPLIQGLGRVDSRVAQQVVHRHDFGDH